MPFPRKDVEDLLAACHRRCCICYRFCGVKIETDHIVPAAEGGPDTIDNAIPVCFECHAEIHSYNDKHPRGRKFTPDELGRHKRQWLGLCKNRPEIFLQAARETDVGPIQALIDELEFNWKVSQYTDSDTLGCLFLVEQFRRAIQEGAIATLKDELKIAILDAYAAMGRANQQISGIMMHAPDGGPWAGAVNRARKGVRDAAPRISAARDALLGFLGSEVPLSNKAGAADA
jgi:hypothetical protein